MAAEKSKGFVLTPSRLGRPNNTEEVPTRPLFTGLKQSKLGLLAESKLNFGAAATPEGGGGEKGEKGEKGGTEEIVKAPTFSFTPLSKKDGDEGENLKLFGSKEADTKESASNPDLPKPVFGENLLGKVAGKVGGLSQEASSVGVFGQNLSEKVILPTADSTTSPEQNKDKEAASANSPSSDLLFSSVAATPQSSDAVPDSGKKTLSEAAAEYTETHSNKRKYQEVPVVTGEEEESNVLQANVKLYLFDREKRSWLERGQGQLRLNDTPNSSPGHLKSRLVMRTTGSLRVVMNTKLWPGMVCERVNQKNLRISAWDDNIIKIFLISCSQKDTDKLFTALDHRLTLLKSEKEGEEGAEPAVKKSHTDSTDTTDTTDSPTDKEED